MNSYTEYLESQIDVMIENDIKLRRSLNHAYCKYGNVIHYSYCCPAAVVSKTTNR